MRRGCENFEYDDEHLERMHREAYEHYRRHGYSTHESYNLATDAVEHVTGFECPAGRIYNDREALRRAEDIMTRSTPSGRLRQTASSRGSEDYDVQRRNPQPSSRRAQPASQTEYDRMFQNGNDKFASRTSGKILSPGDVDKCAKAVFYDLIAEGKNPEYARQKAEQFAFREHGKRNSKMREAGYKFEGDDEDEEVDAVPRPRPNARRGTGRKYRVAEEYDEDDDNDNDYDSGRNRSGYGSRRAGPKETYDTSYPYSDEDLKLMRRKIYEEWCDKGCDPAKAKREAQKWYNDKMKGRQEGRPSSHRSGFDSFNDMRDALDKEDGYPRRNPRPGKYGKSSKSRPSGWDDPQFEKCFTNEPADDYRPHGKTGGGSRGYHTEERRPGGGSSSGGYTSYDEPGGVKPTVNLYKLLGVSENATVAAITKAHKKLILQHHPDRVPGGTAEKKAATEKAAQLNQAVDCLKDYDMRAYYDRTGLIASMGESPDA